MLSLLRLVVESVNIERRTAWHDQHRRAVSVQSGISSCCHVGGLPLVDARICISPVVHDDGHNLCVIAGRYIIEDSWRRRRITAMVTVSFIGTDRMPQRNRAACRWPDRSSSVPPAFAASLIQLDRSIVQCQSISSAPSAATRSIPISSDHCKHYPGATCLARQLSPALPLPLHPVTATSCQPSPSHSSSGFNFASASMAIRPRPHPAQPDVTPPLRLREKCCILPERRIRHRALLVNS